MHNEEYYEEVNEKCSGEDYGWEPSSGPGSHVAVMEELIDMFACEKRLTLIAKNKICGSTAILVPAKRGGAKEYEKHLAIIASRTSRLVSYGKEE